MCGLGIMRVMPEGDRVGWDVLGVVDDEAGGGVVVLFGVSVLVERAANGVRAIVFRLVEGVEQ